MCVERIVMFESCWVVILVREVVIVLEVVIIEFMIF